MPGLVTGSGPAPGIAILALVLLSGCMTGPVDRDELKSILKQQVQRCFLVPASARGEAGPLIEARLSPDGSLADTPKVLRPAPNPQVTRAAIRALTRCAPFAIPAGVTRLSPNGLVMRIEFNTE